MRKQREIKNYKITLRSLKIAKILLWGLLLTASGLYGQTSIVKSIVLSSNVPKDIQLRLTQALDTLIYRIYNNKSISSEIDSAGATLSITMFGNIKGIGIYGSEKNDSLYSPQLINAHIIGEDQYFISLAYVGDNTLKSIMNFKATVYPEGIKFSVPLFYLTRNWKEKKVGRITYHYADYFNQERAAKFNRENTCIAEKLGLPPENFDFYLVDDYFDILRFLGYSYDSETAGHENEGFSPVNGYIFSTMHNEDFSHDLFHYYAEKIRTHSRNSAAEEGIAYSWGNAYYVDNNGEMIDQRQLVEILKSYLLTNPNTSLLNLFSKNPPIFPFNTKVRSLIASLISDEVERRKGLTGIKLMIDCGHGDDNYFKIIKQLIGINATNFDAEVKQLLENYK